MLTLTTIIPQSLIADANHFAACKAVDVFVTLKGSMANLNSYRNPTHQDAQGNLYCVAGIQVSERWANWVMLPVTEHPAHDTEGEIDLAAVNRVQASMVILDGLPGEGEPLPDMTVPILFAGAGVEALGLTRIQED